MIWIPGHNEIGLNELADKEASKGHQSDKLVRMSLTRAAFRSFQHEDVFSCFSRHLSSEIVASTVSEDYPNRESFKQPQPFSWKGIDSNSSILFKIRTGHAGTRVHRKSVYDLEDLDTRCRLCARSPETLSHILLQCEELSELAHIRNELYLTYGPHQTLFKAAMDHPDTQDDDRGRGPALLIKANKILRHRGVWL